MPTPRDIVNALLRIENSLEDAARELGLELFDLMERMCSAEVSKMLEIVEKSRRIGDAILAGRLNRSPILKLHEIANQPLDDPELSSSERVRRAETVRKANVDLLRLANTLTVRDPVRRTAALKETRQEREKREGQEAMDECARRINAGLPDWYHDHASRSRPLMRAHGLHCFPMLKDSCIPDLEHPFYQELKQLHPDIYEEERKFAEDHSRPPMPPFRTPEAATRFAHELHELKEAGKDTTELLERTRRENTIGPAESHRPHARDLNARELIARESHRCKPDDDDHADRTRDNHDPDQDQDQDHMIARVLRLHLPRRGRRSLRRGRRSRNRSSRPATLTARRALRLRRRGSEARAPLPAD